MPGFRVLGEGIISWAYRAAQRFQWWQNDTRDPQVRVGPAALLQTYLKPSVLDGDAPRLEDTGHTLNLITIKREMELPTDFARFRAIWPGPIFEFKPDYKGEPLTDIRVINECLSLAAGRAPEYTENQEPLDVLNWARIACVQLITRPVTEWGGVVASNQIPCFKGSSEGSMALALKAHLAGWIKRNGGDGPLKFEYNEVEDDEVADDLNEFPLRPLRRRIDLHVEGMGDYEVESMKGSGPMESFYHKKIFSRVKKDTRFSLIVPTEAILWAGPYLSDLAHHLTKKSGSVLVPSSDGGFLDIGGKPLVAHPLDELRPNERVEPGNAVPTASEGPIRLENVAGYVNVRCRIDELIIWPEKNRKRLRPASRTSGVLFFGPPGCGKSRWARAIAGELEQEVRLLAPSDLRGRYLGWGQIMIREQFDWLAENDKRMVIIDELDAIARSRRHSQVHSDDQASVNELLVQIDRVLGLGRLLAATTNFVDSMDDAVMRSGRFGRFIPVPPPNAHESVEIVAYYLKRLADQSDTQRTSNVRFPEQDRLAAIIEPLYEEYREDQKF